MTVRNISFQAEPSRHPDLVGNKYRSLSAAAGEIDQLASNKRKTAYPQFTYLIGFWAPCLKMWSTVVPTVLARAAAGRPKNAFRSM